MVRKSKKTEPILSAEEMKELENDIENGGVEKFIGNQEIKIKPLKDFHIVQNEIDIPIKAGQAVTVPRKFLRNLVTEKVIDNIPE